MLQQFFAHNRSFNNHYVPLSVSTNMDYLFLSSATLFVFMFFNILGLQLWISQFVSIFVFSSSLFVFNSFIIIFDHIIPSIDIFTYLHTRVFNIIFSYRFHCPLFVFLFIRLFVSSVISCFFFCDPSQRSQ